MGERLLRRLRYQLVDLVLRYPLARFRRTKPAEIASLIKDEVEPMGQFIGDAFTQPLFLGWPGAHRPGLHFRSERSARISSRWSSSRSRPGWYRACAGAHRARQQRQMWRPANLPAGSAKWSRAIQSVHVNDTSNCERSEISSALGRLFFIRFEIYRAQVLHQVSQQSADPVPGVPVLCGRRLSGDSRFARYRPARRRHRRLQGPAGPDPRL